MITRIEFGTCFKVSCPLSLITDTVSLKIGSDARNNNNNPQNAPIIEM